jgi:flagellar motor switch protein FliM
MRLKRKNRKKLLKKKEDDEYRPTEVLSQAEIDQLLTAINAGDDEPEDFRPANPGKKIKIYDFKRPDKFSKEQIRTVSILHELFARNLTTYFSDLVKASCHVHVASVDQLTYEEFIRSIPTPTTIGVIHYNEANKPTFVNSKSIIEIDPSISRTLINYLTGGNENTFKIQHELTDLERCILETPIIRTLGYMREAWSNICDIRPALGNIETNPAYLQIVPPTEMTVLVTLEVKIGDVEGMLNLCYPYLSLEPIMDKLNAQCWYSSKTKINTKEINLSNIAIELQFELFSKLETYKNLKNIKIDDIIWLNSKNISLFGKLKYNNIYFYTGQIIEPSKTGTELNKIKITEIKNIVEENYMESKNNVVTSLNLNDVQIQLSVELGRTKRTIKDILTWGEGTIIELDSLAGEPVNLFANNVLIAKGEVVVIDENFGLRIVEMVDTENFKEKEY